MIFIHPHHLFDLKLHYLHIIVPQGEIAHPKKESLFQQVLVNFQNTIKNNHISLEFFGYEQYVYCYVVVPDDLLESMEGLIYSVFPGCEIRPTEDYTKAIEAGKHKLAGATLKLKHSDVYSFKSYNEFLEDSQSGLFSVISKITSGKQVWVQIVVNPIHESAGYHFRRSWAMRLARLSEKFKVRDWFRVKGKEGSSIGHKRKQVSQEKYEG